MKIALLGGTGFLGRNFAKHCIEEGWKTLALSRAGCYPYFDSFGSGGAASPRTIWAT